MEMTLIYKDNETIQQEVKEVIEKCTSNLYNLIKYHTKYNQPIEIINDSLSEMIGAAMNNTICCGTAGSGMDNLDGGEVKNSNHTQSKYCASCIKKVTFFAKECPQCGATKFKAHVNQKNTIKTNPRDGRWCVDAKSHFENFGGLNEYRLILTEPTIDEPACRSFQVGYWSLDKNSEHFNLYAKAQYESKKSNTINFMPLRQDFYMSKPVLKFRGILTAHPSTSEIVFEYFNINNTNPEPVPEKYKNCNSKTRVENKLFGKKRGKVSRS